jgi:hypothetical protein
MPYTIRVELHKATALDYTVLHQAMEKAGFSRFIRDSAGALYELPIAEYRYEGVSDLNTITNAAKAAASSTNRGYGVFVSETTQAMWYGLRKTSG